MTRRETILSTLFAALGGVAPEVLRNEPLPVECPPGGLVILLDGEPGQPEVTMSPLTYHYEHRAVLLVLVHQAADRDAAFDAICRAIGLAIQANRTLGGSCDWIEGEPPTPMEIPIEGAPAMKAGEIGIVLHYAASDPLA
ncbi:acyl-CoA transferase [Frigidibacter sp. MR17.14]|uniref:acyl-CoA transferase n=1 Tax=Frigidibacter sp. MR17.14 TaxID=3126509 RepID=UPI003012EECC